MFIQTESTTDPNRLKFLPGQQVLSKGTLEISDKQAAANSPLAAKLFAVEGVAALSFGPDYITITKSGGEWQHLKPALLGAIMEHFISGAPILSGTAESNAPSAQQDNDARVTNIRAALRQVIDPELGYNIVDLGLIYDVSVSEDGIASVTMTTTTPGCPATNYLKEGARESAEGTDGISMAEITLTHEPRWSPALMSDDAKAHFGIRDGDY
jgi:metal-sulfur cluster biosynthetic enzyme